LKTVILIDLAIFVTAGIVSWFIGWRTLYQYCDAVQLGGMLAIVVGVWMFWQEWNANRSFDHMHAQSMTDLDGHQRVRLLRRDDDAAYAVFLHALIAGLTAVILAALIQIFINSFPSGV
jgi:hypothetical protein